MARRRNPEQRLAAQERIVQLDSLLALVEGRVVVSTTLELQPGERAVCHIDRSEALETFADPGYWSGGTKGVSLGPGDTGIDGGRFAGSYLVAISSPQMLDRGMTTITDRRVVFRGTWFRREWTFSAITAVSHYVNAPSTVIEATDRPNAFGFSYPTAEINSVRSRLALAGAMFDGDQDQVIRYLERQLRRIRKGTSREP